MIWRTVGFVVTIAALGLAVAFTQVGSGGADEGAHAQAPGLGADEVSTSVEVPRVCWFSDYKKEQPGLSNKCRFVEEDQAWIVEVDGEWLPAEGQPLPTANLCHYFYGPECPPRD